MQDCDHELNRQIKGLQARLSQAENNITSHFVGMSLLCQSLLATPAAAAGAAMSSIYNLVPSGIEIFQNLIQQISAIDAKSFMMQAAAALEDAMAAELDALVGMVSDMMDALIADAFGALNAAIATVEAATIALEEAITAGIQGPIDAATAALNAAKATADSAQATLDSLKNLKISSTTMLKAQAHAARCNSIGGVINS